MKLFDSFANDDEEIPGLSDFDKRMYDKFDEMYKKGRKRRRNNQIFKTMAMTAAVLLLTFIFYPPIFGKVSAWFIKTFNLNINDKGEYTEFRLEPKNNQSIEEFEGYYYPRYIPDKYEVNIKNNMETIGTIIYSNKTDDSSITYSFSTLSAPLQLDTENCSKENILINDCMGLLYKKEDNSRNIIIYQNDEYKFVVSGNIDVDTLKEISESIEK